MSATPPARRTPLAALPLVALVRLYQVTLSPLLGGRCRFTPTCSHYALDALREHGALRGSALTARRILRCHPFGGSGYDPVPPCAERGPEAPQEDDRARQGGGTTRPPGT